jgi:glyoxylase-like metal-dependent hydrolase (beta-lactamase superfamily II)
MRKTFLTSAAVATLASLLAMGAAAQQNRTQSAPPSSSNANKTEIGVLPVRGNIYMLVGAGGNITASIGPEGVLLVDTGLANRASDVLAAINKLSMEVETKGLPNVNVGPPKAIRVIVNTHVHADHTGGNAVLAKAGRTYTGGNVAGNLADAGEQAAIYAHEEVLNRMSNPAPGEPKIAFEAFPTDTYHTEGMSLSHFFNGDGVRLIHAPTAHTDGDTMVYFRGSDVLSTGDVFSPSGYPVIDIEHGGSYQGTLDALNNILDIAIPEFRLEGGTMIVPGHGHLCDIADVAYYRDMATIIRDRLQDAIKRGLTLPQIKAAKLTYDYDGIYGATTGFWTTDKFLDAAYKSLTEKKAAR